MLMRHTSITHLFLSRIQKVTHMVYLSINVKKLPNNAQGTQILCCALLITSACVPEAWCLVGIGLL